MSKARNISDVLVSPDFTGTVTADGLTVDGATILEAASGQLRLQGTTTTAKNVSIQYSESGDYGQINCDQSGVNQKDLWVTGLNLKFGRSTGSESMRITHAGLVGIGTSSPASILALKKNANGALGPEITLENGFGSAGSSNRVTFKQDQSTSFIEGNLAGAATSGSSLVLGTSSGNSAGTERIRIDSAGTMLIQTGGAAPSSSQEGISLGLSGPNGAKIIVANTLTSTFSGAMVFINGNGQVGTISTSGSATSYNTSSDYRLKTDVQPMTGATATFMQLKPCNFEWIASEGERVDGFLAHELQEVIPAAATGTHNGMMDEEYQATPATGDIYTAGTEAGYNEVSPEVVGGPAYYDINGVQIRAEIIAEPAVHEAFDSVDEVIHSSDVEQPETLEDGQAWRETTAQVMATRSVPDMQGIDQAKVVPLLVATLQEALARIEALEA